MREMEKTQKGGFAVLLRTERAREGKNKVSRQVSSLHPQGGIDLEKVYFFHIRHFSASLTRFPLLIISVAVESSLLFTVPLPGDGTRRRSLFPGQERGMPAPPLPPVVSTSDSVPFFASAEAKEAHRRAILGTPRPSQTSAGSNGRSGDTPNGSGSFRPTNSLSASLADARSIASTHGASGAESGTDVASSGFVGAPNSVEAAFGTKAEALRPLHAQMLHRYFGGEMRLMGLYFAAVLGEVTIIEENQTKFRTEFVTFVMARRKEFRWVTRQEVARLRRIDMEAGELPVARTHFVWVARSDMVSDLLHTNAERAALWNNADPVSKLPPPPPTTPNTHFGYMSFPHEVIIDWVTEFLTKPRDEHGDRYETLVDIPRAILLPFFDPTLGQLLSKFIGTFVDNILDRNSPDRRQWWRYGNVDNTHLNPHKFLYPYQQVETLAWDLDVLTAERLTVEDRETRTEMSAALHLFEQRQHVTNASQRVDLVRVALTCGLYVRYALANRLICLNKLRPTDNPDALVGILFAFVVGDMDTLNPIENPLLCRLHERSHEAASGVVGNDTSTALHALARMACDIRRWVIDELSAEKRIFQSQENHCRGMIVRALYRRTAGLVRGAAMLREVCRLTLASIHRVDMRRQVTVAANRIAFTRFLHQLEAQTHLVKERLALRAWVARCTPWLRYDDVLWARSMTATMPNLPTPGAPPERFAEYRNLHQQRGLDLMEHMQLCDHNVIVLRLSRSVSLEEIRLSLDYYCAVFPCCLSETLASMFHVGADDEGVFLVAERTHHALLTQTMLLAACTTPGFRHNAPLFPALSRLFFCTFDGGQPEPPSPLLQLDSGELLHPDHHALYCFAGILAHWLGLPTAAPTDMVVPLDSNTRLLVGGDKTSHAASESRQRLMFSSNESEGPILVRKCYLPSTTDECFTNLKWLHSFAVRLEIAAGKVFDTTRDLSDGLAEALAGHLELKRPRRLNGDTAGSLADRLEAHNDDKRYTPLIEHIRTFLESLPGGDYDTKRTNGKRRSAPDDNPLDIADPELVSLIYSASDCDHLGVELTRHLFLEGGLIPLGRERVLVSKLRFSAKLPEESTDERQYTRDITGGYINMFAARNAGCTRMAKPSVCARLPDVPIEPLGHLIRLLETAVAPVTLAEALGATGREGGIGDADPPPCRAWGEWHRQHPSSPGLMDNPTSRSLVARFDFTGYIGARKLTKSGKLDCGDPHAIRVEKCPELETPEALHKLRAVRARMAPYVPHDALPTIDAQSYTPIQFWPATNGALPAQGKESPRITVTYLESFFSLALFSGGTYTNHLKESGVDLDGSPVLTSRASVTITPEMLSTPRSTNKIKDEEDQEMEDVQDEAIEEMESDDSSFKSAATMKRVIQSPTPTAKELEQMRSTARSDRIEFVHMLNHSYQLANLFTKDVPRVLDPDDLLEALLCRLKALEEKSRKMRRADTPPSDSRFDNRLFPFRFESREAMGKFICSVLRSPMVGETTEQRAERLKANMRVSKGRQILDFLCRLYALCDSPLYDRRDALSPEEDAYSELYDSDVASPNDLRIFSQLVNEAMRRGLFYTLAKAQISEEPVDLSDIEDFFQEITCTMKGE